MFKKIYLLGIIAFFALSTSFNAQSGVLIYEDDGIIFIPQIKVMDNYYAATLQFLPITKSSPAFSILEVNTIDDIDLIDDTFATYEVSSNTVSLFNVAVGDTFYNINLQRQEDGTLLVTSWKDITFTSLLFMINNAAGSFNETGVYDGQTIGNHFVIDLNSPLIAFSDRPHRFSQEIPEGLQLFPQVYADSDFAIHLPNTTFSGKSVTTNIAQSTIFEMGKPIISAGKFIIPLKTPKN
jgi:hypothetical protein